MPEVAGTGMVVALSKSPSGQDVFSGAIVMWFGTFGALSCIANIYAVILMSWKAWLDPPSLTHAWRHHSTD